MYSIRPPLGNCRLLVLAASCMISFGACEPTDDGNIPSYHDSPCKAGAELCLLFEHHNDDGSGAACCVCDGPTSTLQVRVTDAKGMLVGSYGPGDWSEFSPCDGGRGLCIQGLPGRIPLTIEVLVMCPTVATRNGVPCGSSQFTQFGYNSLTLACGMRDYATVPLY